MTPAHPGEATTGAPPRAVQTFAEAQHLVGHLIDVMDALLGIVDEETELVRAGRLRAAADLAQTKGDLTKLYVTDIMRLKASHAYYVSHAPDAIEDLRRRHDQFRALLQINLTVLATAHAVSEGIIRGVSEELTRKSAPETYGATGRPNAPSPSMVQPISLSRTL
jgi:flagellar biosynthesis/type III secretory pathway chaperone